MKIHLSSLIRRGLICRQFVVFVPISPCLFLSRRKQHIKYPTQKKNRSHYVENRSPFHSTLLRRKKELKRRKEGKKEDTFILYSNFNPYITELARFQLLWQSLSDSLSQFVLSSFTHSLVFVRSTNLNDQQYSHKISNPFLYLPQLLIVAWYF